jgi:hypothetical protein
MAQHDYVIDNQTAPNFRADLNNALAAIVSTNSGASAPATTYANMLWYDTANNVLKMRSEADDAWIDIGTLNQSTDTFEVAGLTTQAQATWEAGTSTTESIVSPAKVKAAVDNQFNVSGSAPKYACRAWVNFNGTGTVAIRASGNVSSITDNGTGDYTINFSTALPDSNYSVATSGTLRGNTSNTHGVLQIQNISSTTPTTPALMSTTQVRVALKSTTSTTTWDSPTICAAIFR